MKKIICLIIALLLPAACTSAEQYLEASFSFSGISDNRIETIDLYEQDQKITAVSTLTPEYAVMTDQTMYTSLSLFHSICSMNPENTRECIEKTDKQIRDKIEQLLSDPVPGVYSGELFENAGSVRTVRLQLTDFFTYISSVLDSSDEPFFRACKAAVSSLMEAESGQELFLDIQIYDSWKYISALLFKNEQAIMTISSDLSSENAKRILICYSENGRHYYRDILIKDDQDAFTLTASLRSGSESTYQRMITEMPLTAVLLTVTNERFDLELYGNGLSEPLMATGKTAAQENGEAQLTAKVYINHHDEQAINITINLSQMARAAGFSDKEIIHLSDQTENAGFIITAVSKATELAAEMIPTLPDEYQKLMIKLLYP